MSVKPETENTTPTGNSLSKNGGNSVFWNADNRFFYFFFFNLKIFILKYKSNDVESKMISWKFF